MVTKVRFFLSDFKKYTKFDCRYLLYTIQIQSYALEPQPNPDLQKSKALAEVLNVEPLVAQLLLQRGIETFDEARQFSVPI
jgi:hypothetical protein